MRDRVSEKCETHCRVTEEEQKKDNMRVNRGRTFWKEEEQIKAVQCEGKKSWTPHNPM